MNWTFFGVFLGGFCVGGILFFLVSNPQPFDAYFGEGFVNFASFEDFELACDAVAGKINCGPECTCNFLYRQKMLDEVNKAGELINKCADMAMIVIDERDACLKKLNEE